MAIEKSPNVPPFVTYCAQLVPTVFDDSLSYYEALCALAKWMQDNLVDVVNNNAEVTEEYIQLTKDLKKYMDEYFDNLNIQTEINNKLDEMVEDGTLAEIINEDIFNTLYTSKTEWKNVVSLGLHNDGVTPNDSLLAGILATASDGDVFYFPKGTYLFNSRVTFANLSNITLRFEGIIKSENGVLLDTLTRCNIYGLNIQRDYTRYDYTSLSGTGLEIFNSKYLSFYNPYVAGFNKGFFWHSDGISNSFNVLYNAHSFDNLHAWSTLNENGGFTNEINVFGGRFSLNTGETDVAGIADYVVVPEDANEQNFYGVCMEGKITKVILNGNYCTFNACRFEGQSSNNEDVIVNGNSNTIEGCYWSELTGASKITNNGNYNVIFSNRQIISQKLERLNYHTITASYTLSGTYDTIFCDATNGDITINIPNTVVNYTYAKVRFMKTDYSDHIVKFTTTGQTSYQLIGRGNALKNIGDYCVMHFDGTNWILDEINTIYETALPSNVETNIVEGLIVRDGKNQKVVTEGGTYFTSQITNTYCATTAGSPDITLIIGSSNRVLRLGNYINIAGEAGYFKIVKLDLANDSATLNRPVTNTADNVRITYHTAVIKYLGLVYDKVDNLPASGTIGDIVFYNTPTAGGYIGAVYTAGGWKNFGAIAS